LPDLGAEEGKVLLRGRERRCDVVYYTAGVEEVMEWGSSRIFQTENE
jgi:hypothetical protein